VVRVTVRLDGSISGRPRIARSSGYEDLDEAALQAVIASLPFAAIPPDLARGRTQLEVTLPVAFSNPMVQ
jgi:TonB family protein